MKIVSLSVLAALVATSALANPAVKVPEIDAMAGTAALAVVGATIALIRERRTRRK